MITELRKINRIQILFSNDEIKEKVSHFLFMFFFCEKIYKELLLKYKQKTSPNVEVGKLQIFIPDVFKVLDTYNINYDESSIRELFGSKNDNLSNCTIKKLRDRLVHNITNECVDAIIKRYEQSISIMNKFLKLLEDKFNEKNGM